MWCGGRTLVEIEAWLLDFVREHEGTVKKQASRSSTAQRARRFAIRITPDLGFMCGIVGQIVAHRASEGQGAMLPVIDMLPQMVRAGDYDRHHAAMRLMKTTASRVESFQTHLALRGSFKAGASTDMDTVRDEVVTAMLVQTLFDWDDED